MNGNNESDLFRKMTANIDSLEQDRDDSECQSSRNSQIAPLVVVQKLANCDHECLSLEHANMLKPDDIVSFKRDDVQDCVFRNLKLGEYAIDSRLDLHKYTLKDARDEILKFLKQCQRMDIRTVIIVHGKGEGTNHPSRMKSFVCQWLEQISEVTCIHSAQRHHGGTGAVYVRLKKSQEKKLETRGKHINQQD